MSETLKPCPFCGNEPKEREHGRTWAVYCECELAPTVERISELAARSVWNTRPAPQAEAGRPEALERLYQSCLNLQGQLDPSIFGEKVVEEFENSLRDSGTMFGARPSDSLKEKP